MQIWQLEGREKWPLFAQVGKLLAVDDYAPPGDVGRRRRRQENTTGGGAFQPVAFWPSHDNVPDSIIVTATSSANIPILSIHGDEFFSFFLLLLLLNAFNKLQVRYSR